MKTPLFIIFFLTIGIGLFAQNSFERVYQTIEPSQGKGIVEVSDGGFALAVQKSDSIVGIIRIDNFGDTLWTRWYPEVSAVHGSLSVNAITQAPDNNLYFVGAVSSGTAFVIKTNESGDMQWISLREQISLPEIYTNIIALSNDSLIVMGSYYVGESESCCGPILDVVDSEGDITPFGSGSTAWAGATLDCYAKDSNGNLILSGLYPNPIGIGRLTKRDPSGSYLWNESYSNLQVTFTSIATGPEDEILTVGTTYTNNFDSTLVFVFDSNGNFINQKAYNCTEQNWEGHSIVRTIDGYFVGGRTGGDFVLMRLNLSHELISCQTFGGSSGEYLDDMISTSDGGVAMIGRSSSFGDNGPDTYLVKTDASGNVVSTSDINLKPNGFEIFPNPCTTSLTLTSTDAMENLTLGIFSLNGKQVLNRERVSGHQIELDVDRIPGGIYILTLHKDNAIINTQKVVIVD